jgi:hypothetical protein
MISFGSMYLQKALGAHLPDYVVRCRRLKNGTLEFVLSHINSHETYGISGVSRMNCFSARAVTRLAQLLLNEIDACQRLGLSDPDPRRVRQSAKPALSPAGSQSYAFVALPRP